MLTFFLISLPIAMLAAWLYANASEEMERVVSLAIVSLWCLMNVAIAPWPIQLGILLFVLFTTRNVAAT